MKGKVCQWHDEKGFGFIQPENGSDTLFFHISSVKTTARRPQVGDCVLYDSTRDAQNRLRAKGVVIEGVSRASGASARSRSEKIQPPRRNAIDYIAILVIVGAFIATGIAFYHTGSIESSWMYGVPAFIGFLVLSRQRKPIEKNFTCARCRTISEFDSRTIRAWNNGFLKLYCERCHRQWLDNNARKEEDRVRGNRGCLGVLAVMILVPSIGGVGIYHWLT